MRQFINIVETALKSDISIQHFKDNDDGLNCIIVLAHYNGEFAGEGKFDLDRHIFRGIDVDPQFRRKGVATAIYDYVNSLGYEVNPSSIQTPDGNAFWNARRKVEESAQITANDFISLVSDALKNISGVHVGLAPNYDNPNYVEIVNIYSDVQGGGKGTEAMKLICELADRYGVTLTLGVQNETDDEYEEGDPSEDVLVEWYYRFGFELIEDFTSERINMIRTPFE